MFCKNSIERRITNVRELKKVDDHISLFEMKSDALEVLVTNLGGTIIRLLMPDKNGQKGDVVLGYDSIAEYQAKDAYLGALVGRTANRTRKGDLFSQRENLYPAPQRWAQQPAWRDTWLLPKGL